MKFNQFLSGCMCIVNFCFHHPKTPFLNNKYEIVSCTCMSLLSPTEIICTILYFYLCFLT